MKFIAFLAITAATVDAVTIQKAAEPYEPFKFPKLIPMPTPLQNPLPIMNETRFGNGDNITYLPPGYKAPEPVKCSGPNCNYDPKFVPIPAPPQKDPLPITNTGRWGDGDNIILATSKK